MWSWQWHCWGHPGWHFAVMTLGDLSSFKFLPATSPGCFSWIIRPRSGWRLIRYLCIPELISRGSLMESLAQAQPPTGAFGVADFTEWIIEWVPKQNSFLEKQHILFMASNHGTETIKVEQCDSGDPLQQLECKATHTTNILNVWVTYWLSPGLAEFFIEEI